MKTKQLGILAAVAALSTPAMGDLLIDHFNAPPPGETLIDLPGGGSASSLTADAAIIGGWRASTLTASGVGPALVFINVVPDRLSIANSATSSSVTVVTYDANGAGLGDLDLVGGGFDSVEFALEASDFNTGLKVNLYDGGTVSTANVLLPTSPPGVSFHIPFASFTTVGAGNPFGSLDKIVLEFDAPVFADILVNEFSFTGNIPEASSVMSVFGLLGVIGLCAHRRWRMS